MPATHRTAPSVRSSRTAPRGFPTQSARALFDEERAKDVATFAVASRRRFWCTLVVTAVLGVCVQLGLTDTSLVAAAVLVCAAIVGNVVVSRVGATAACYRWWLKYLFAVFDTLLVSCVVYLFGSPVLVVAYVLVIVPYSFDRGPTLGYVATLASTLGFLTASYGYAAMRPAAAAPWPEVLLAAMLLVVVSQQIIQMPSRLIARIRRTRERMAQVERGDLRARADARQNDELGFLERGYNRMLDDLTVLIETMQKDSDELAAVAVQVYGSASDLQRRAGDVASGAHELRDEIAQQRLRAGSGVEAGKRARDNAELMHAKCDATSRAAHTADDTAAASREAIERAAQTLVRVGADVDATADRVRLLAPASERVGDFVAAVSRIARQTSLLSLNAAIEASRAGEHGLGFAVVAEEIRKLAGESAMAAKQIATTVQRVRDDIDGAVHAMDRTARAVSDAGSIANNATAALAAMVDDISRIAQHSDDVAALAQAQSNVSSAVAGAFEALDESAARAARSAGGAATAAASQRSSIDELSRSAAQLSMTAARMRALVVQHTAEFAVPDNDRSIEQKHENNSAIALAGDNTELPQEPIFHGLRLGRSAEVPSFDGNDRLLGRRDEIVRGV